MPQFALQAPPPPARQIEAETLRQLLGMNMRHTLGNLAANLVVAFLAAALFWHETGSTSLWAWFVCTLLISLARGLWHMRLRRQLPYLNAPGLLRAEKMTTLLIALSGMVWGGLALIVYDGAQVRLDFFATAIIIGMTGGAVTPLSSLRHAYPLYASAVLLPFIAKSFWLDGSIYLVGGITVGVYLIVLLSYSRVTHRTLLHSFQLQQEKDDLIRELEAMTCSRSLFLAGVSHDLKQPVQALGMFIACLSGRAQAETGELGEELKRLAHSSGLALAAISGQVSRLLELSRLEAGEIQPRRRRVRLADIFDYTRAQQAGKAADKGLRLRFVETRLEVISDLKMLQSILDNLVSNAVRYTLSGRILVGARRRGDHIEVQVWDSGPGIPEATIPLLFEAYRRFDDTARGAEMGFGLGLALVKKQADLLGHALAVHSRPGWGSLFSVRLPDASDLRDGPV